MSGARGGDQKIPRPLAAARGPSPPWLDLDAASRRLTIGQIDRRLRRLPPARRAAPRSPDSSPAAVLVPLFEEGGEARVILTRRPDTMPTHRGEVAFPGGRHEPGVDEDLRATALRETHEEIGLDPARVDVVRELDGIATVGSRFTITPFVGFIEGRPELRPDDWEVVRVFDVALSDLLHPDTYRSEVWNIRAGYDEPFEVHFYEIPGETIWGATARILTDFLRALVVV